VYPLDTNSELLGVSNGIIEICGSKAYFRKGKPEDYITKSTKIPLAIDMTESHPMVIKLKKYLGQVFVDRDLGHHFLKLAASKLRGRNIHKILEVWTGDKGNNSKSMMVKLHEKTFGDYFIKFPTEILTNKKNLGGPNPELAQAEGARIGCIQETAADRPMQPDTIKQLTGGDSFFARNCCQDGGKIESMFKTILMCNKVARIEGADQPIYDRLRLVPFTSQWVNNPPESEEEQYRQRLFKKVGDFEHQISEMAKAFLWLIFNYYEIYTEEGLVDPPCVIQVTENYWSETDPYNQFISEQIKSVKNAKGDPDMTVSVSCGDLFTAFSTWRKINYPGVLPPNSSTVSQPTDDIGVTNWNQKTPENELCFNLEKYFPN
jgi:phage/plasmid-associated DNA primase